MSIARPGTGSKRVPEEVTNVRITRLDDATSWRQPSHHPTLSSEEVHVWRATLDRTASRVEELCQVLEADEAARADRYLFARDREHFIVARAFLRFLLSRYLGTEPALVRFHYDLHGKPALAGDSTGTRIRFNLSHAHGLALCAVTCDRNLGIDVEWIRPRVIEEQIAERYFCPREVAKLRALPRDQQAEAFFNCWTRKEAYVKARGEGLSIPLDQFEVSLVPDEPVALLYVRADLDQASRWSLCELHPGPGYVAALAVEGCRWQLTGWNYLD